MTSFVEPQRSISVSFGLSVLILGLFLSLPLVLPAQENDDCLMCHEDTELEGERGGEAISVHVDPALFATSIHAEFACIDCHADLDGAELPHDEDLEAADCGMCHDDMLEDHNKGPHGGWPPVSGSPSSACVRCHGTHDVRPSSDPESPTGHAQVTDLCASCHSQQKAEMRASPHSRLRDGQPAASCVSCHLGHKMQAPSDPVGQQASCGLCHQREAKAHQRSLHGSAAIKGDPLAPTCVTCHQHHEIRSRIDPGSPTATMNVPLLCGQCHREGSDVSEQKNIPQDRILENFSMSVHGEGLFQKGLTVTAVCTSCHTAHDILDHNHPASGINRQNIAGTCMTCHARIEEVHTKVIEGRLWEEEPHKVPSCPECHQPHKIRRRAPSAVGAASRDCMGCHGDAELSMEKDGRDISLYVDEEAFTLFEHATVACAQCHTDVSPNHPERACATIASPVDCSICHADRVQEHELSSHGRYAQEGDLDAPTCLTCHEKHETQSHRLPTSRTFARNVPELCGTCHREGQVAANRIDSGIHDIVESFVQSAHGKGLLESGLVVSASCVDCHSSHQPLPMDNPDSSIHSDRIADTCGGCHKGIQEEFEDSIHWPGNAITTEPLPTCEDCHTSHTITRTDAQGFRMQMMDQCGHCHQDFAETFFDTYHGKVTQLGSEGAAKCYDCHGTHNILPTSDPNSTLSHFNEVETCAQCHARAHKQFAGYLSHATHHDPDRYPYLYYSFWFMTFLLVGTLSFFIVHTLFWLFRLWRTRHQWRPLKEAGENGEKFYRRFSRKQRIMHLVMLLSFFVLALTGMALKFSYMTWAQVLSRLLGGFDSMGTLHRIGAVALLALFAYHIRDVWRAKRDSGKGWVAFIFGKNSLMFNLNDFKEFVASWKWFLGLGPRPHYGRFTYWEKFDYFAVFWGVFVIGSTGLLLWFPELFTRILPGWSVNVATIIHSDEALLAVGFIFTIHFFNTHFRPDKFPMDPVIFTGRVALDELKHDKPEEYREFVENATEEELEERIAGPARPGAERLVRSLGFTALAIGLTLIFLIVYSMLFAYK